MKATNSTNILTITTNKHYSDVYPSGKYRPKKRPRPISKNCDAKISGVNTPQENLKAKDAFLYTSLKPHIPIRRALLEGVVCIET